MNQERRDQIMKMARENRVVKNRDLMERFGISIETVRRDLKYLEKQGRLECVYGGAVLKQAPAAASGLEASHASHSAEKEAIAREAANIIESGETIFLEEGSTVFAMTRYLKDISPLTVITSSLRIAVELGSQPGCTVIMPGGRVMPGTLELTGFQSDENLGLFNIDKAFIGVNGITDTHFTDYSMIDRMYIRRRVIENSAQAIVLADYSKFGVRATVNVASVNELDMVITDDKTPESYVKKLKDSGVRVIVAKA